FKDFRAPASYIGEDCVADRNGSAQARMKAHLPGIHMELTLGRLMFPETLRIGGAAAMAPKPYASLARHPVHHEQSSHDRRGAPRYRWRKSSRRDRKNAPPVRPSA